MSGGLSLGFARVDGPPTDFSGVNIRSATGEQTGGGGSGKKASGILMVEGVLYMWVRNADLNGRKSQLAWSADHARTWSWSTWRFEELGYCTFLNFGKNYTGARDEYVYTYSPNTDSAYAETDEVVLARVPKGEITNRAAYEFFTGRDDQGDPLWSPNIDRRSAVFLFPGGCNRLSITYNPGLRHYLLTMRSRARAGGLDQFSIYEAPEPWGPWHTVFFTRDWDTSPGESQHLPSKWMSEDGSTLYLVFSGGDAFSVRRLDLEVAESADTVPPAPPENLRVE